MKKIGEKSDVVNKKSKIIIVLLILLFILAIPVIYFYAVAEFFHYLGEGMDIREGEEIVKTSLGDEFLVDYIGGNFPDLSTNIAIYDEHNNRLIMYILEDYYETPEFNAVINVKDLRVYQIELINKFNDSIIGASDILIYKVENKAFDGISVRYSIRDLTGYVYYEEKHDMADVITVAKTLVEKKEWEWIMAFGDFLVEAGDDEILNILQRYAGGDFTEEELKINKDSIITTRHIQDFAIRVLAEPRNGK
ncbi:hypothetical protein F8154_09245 [Alkaliphilus pronyensis]|uniref:Uncharacterized protein n=1 Tax=Alkaliphilus pronyensis TaxID=1482732 RepID=A0A6I0F7Q2_9FIRM|nr:hypothetical protein [Alkaliphilus pronyensis]KAB3534396.1 hypothetical protein F8154_09245 [Alkaliphilus pronyensis]